MCSRLRKVKGDVRWLVLALPLLALVASCSGDEPLPLCADVSWLDRFSPAELTAPPSFTASQIAPGDPLALLVPVNEHTREVWVWVRFTEDPDRRTRITADLIAETDGDETVRLPLEDTDLAPGVYFAEWISLEGDEDSYGDTFYFEWDNVSEVAMTYILGVPYAAEVTFTCQSDVPVPTFEVVGD
jgi:hypothetical protein